MPLFWQHQQMQMQEFTKKVVGSGTTIFIISNEDMEDVINIVKSLKNKIY